MRFSREERRKTRKVGATRVHLGLGKIRVGRAGDYDVGTESLRDVKARLKFAFHVGRQSRDSAARGDRRPRRQAEPQVELGQARHQPRATGLGDLVLSRRERPSIRFELSLNAPLHVEMPFSEAWIEAHVWIGIQVSAIRRCPSASCRLPRCHPSRRFRFTARIDEAVVAGATPVHREHIAGPAVEKRAQDKSTVSVTEIVGSRPSEMTTITAVLSGLYLHRVINQVHERAPQELPIGVDHHTRRAVHPQSLPPFLGKDRMVASPVNAGSGGPGNPGVWFALGPVATRPLAG